MSPLISPEQLLSKLDNPNLIIIDCRFQLIAGPEDAHPGLTSYRQQHIPNAQYADLNVDLSSPVIPGVTGRHPLPNLEQLEQRLKQWGVCEDSQIVCYDSSGGAFAVRLWWLLQWCGFNAVSVLDGGWQAWKALHGPVSAEITTPTSGDFAIRSIKDWVITAEDIMKTPAGFRLMDARGADRYRGDNETIDPVAGHIPLAASLPFTDNLTTGGQFQSADTLRSRFSPFIETGTLVHYCGSGVTACHNWFAMTLAGLPPGKLYAGSWSDWITDPQRPIATGPLE